MSITQLFDGIADFFIQIGDFFVMLWNMLVSHLELLWRYINWMVKSIPEIFSFLVYGWGYISKVLIALPSPVIVGISMLIVLPFAIVAIKIVSKL